LVAGTVLATGAFAQPFQILQDRNITVYYSDSLRPAAVKTIEVFPKVYEDLVSVFLWKLRARPSVVLIKEREQFLKIGESPLSVAFAVPEKNLIVVDYSRMVAGPFRFPVTFKHELCHLLLHQHIPLSSLPRWLDEGLCQWVSDGIDEIIMDQQHSILNRAAISNDFIALSALRSRFPRGERELILAYQESKSFVSYLFSRFGKKRVLSLLALLATNRAPESAFQETFSTSLENLEQEWHSQIKPAVAWLEQISYHLYEILFAFAAIVCVYAFVRVLLRKRSEGRINEDDFS
jgi:hypothetical protein